MRVEAGSFARIYDPSVDEAERWYVDDHTFVRDRSGTWHLFGITHAEPVNPHDERHLAHATAPSLHGPWTKHPFALSADPGWQESVLWAPDVLVHDDRHWMFVCGGGPRPTDATWVSHCGWGQGGVYLASLRWSDGPADA